MCGEPGFKGFWYSMLVELVGITGIRVQLLYVWKLKSRDFAFGFGLMPENVDPERCLPTVYSKIMHDLNNTAVPEFPGHEAFRAMPGL